MKIGLVLSGGGARGIAHIGVIKALQEHGIRLSHISATSAGAFVGALFSYGYSPEEILDLIVQTRFFPHFRFGLGSSGILHLRNLETVIQKLIPENTFESLKIPLTINATDVTSGEEVLFNSGELAIPLLGSCCIPGLFSPMTFHGHDLVDGGVLNNLPVESLETEVDLIIGSHCNPFSLEKPLKSTREIIYRSLILAVHNKTKERCQKCDILIEPPALQRFGLFDFRKARELFDVGYDDAMKILSVNENPFKNR